MPEFHCAPCNQIECTNPVDVETFSLQSGIIFTSGVLSAVASCPEGFICPPGVYPRTFIYDDDDWTVMFPPPVILGGGPVMVKGCESDIVRIVPAGATNEQMEAIANEMFEEAAEQQARCDAISDPNNRNPGTPTFQMTAFAPTTACQDTAYSTSVEVNSASATFTIIGTLPTGLALTQSGNTATVSGTPTTLGTTVFAIKAVSGSNEAVQQVTFAVIGITNSSPLADAFQNAAYSETLTVSGMGVVTWAVTSGALPTGLSLNPNTGEISGTPTVLGTFNFTIQATSV